ncbi:hypothetical protein [Geodermatophilus sp. SYSU D00698]
MQVPVGTHPGVLVDPAVPSPRGLSDARRARLQHLVALPWTVRLARVVSGAGRQAGGTAAALRRPPT